MGLNRKAPETDKLAKFLRDFLTEHGATKTKDLEDAVKEKRFSLNTYAKNRNQFRKDGWLDSRRENSGTVWFLTDNKSSTNPPKPAQSPFPSINLQSLNVDETIRMLQAADDPLIRRLLFFLETNNDDKHEEGRKEGYQEGHKDALNQAKDIVQEVEGKFDANPVTTRIFKTLLSSLEQLDQ